MRLFVLSVLLMASCGGGECLDYAERLCYWYSRCISPQPATCAQKQADGLAAHGYSEQQCAGYQKTIDMVRSCDDFSEIAVDVSR